MPNHAYANKTSLEALNSAGEANQTYADYPRNRCLHQLLADRAQCSPNSIAVECDGKSLTYAELDGRSNQLAHYLQRQGIGAESLVGLCVDRSVEMVVALLGILKAGGAYVPLDPAYPSDRIKYVLDDARVGLLLTAAVLACFLARTAAESVCLDPEWRCIPGRRIQRPRKLRSNARESGLRHLYVRINGQAKGCATGAPQRREFPVFDAARTRHDRE